MTRPYARPCPLCGALDPEPLVSLPWGRLDGCRLEPRVTLLACRVCGQAYDEVADPAALEAYYRREAVTAHCQGGGPEASPAELEDQEAVYAAVAARGRPRGLWADVGCGRGGLLFHLRARGLTDLLGVDLNPACLRGLRAGGIRAEFGAADRLPLPTGSAGVLSYCQVLEHVYDPLALLREARRVLRPEGLILVEVPEAGAYGRSPRNNHFQWLIAEHINHFDQAHLRALLEVGGFEVLEADERLANRNTEADFPVAWALARPARPGPGTPEGWRVGGGAAEDLGQSLRRQIQKGFDLSRGPEEELKRIVAGGRPIWLWALSAAFWYFYGQSGLGRANIRGLIDQNENFAAHTLEGRPIRGLAALSEAGAGDLVILFSHSQKARMRAYLDEIGFAGEVLALV